MLCACVQWLSSTNAGLSFGIARASFVCVGRLSLYVAASVCAVREGSPPTETSPTCIHEGVRFKACWLIIEVGFDSRMSAATSWGVLLQGTRCSGRDEPTAAWCHKSNIVIVLKLVREGPTLDPPCFAQNVKPQRQLCFLFFHVVVELRNKQRVRRCCVRCKAEQLHVVYDGVSCVLLSRCVHVSVERSQPHQSSCTTALVYIERAPTSFIACHVPNSCVGCR